MPPAEAPPLARRGHTSMAHSIVAHRLSGLTRVDSLGLDNPPTLAMNLTPSPGKTIYQDREVGSMNQPFIPVRATPWMKYRWSRKKTMTTGRVMTTEAAMIRVNWFSRPAMKLNRPRAAG